MKKIVEVMYRFEINYKHEKHLEDILRDLRNAPISELGGAGMVDNKAYGYSCKRIGDGKIV